MINVDCNLYLENNKLNNNAAHIPSFFNFLFKNQIGCKAITNIIIIIPL